MGILKSWMYRKIRWHEISIQRRQRVKSSKNGHPNPQQAIAEELVLVNRDDQSNNLARWLMWFLLFTIIIHRERITARMTFLVARCRTLPPKMSFSLNRFSLPHRNFDPHPNSIILFLTNYIRLFCKWMPFDRRPRTHLAAKTGFSRIQRGAWSIVSVRPSSFL